MAHVIFRFGDFELDTAAYELRRKGRRVRLGRQPMDLLLLLLERRHELVSREEIGQRLWGPDVFVDRDAGIHTAVMKVRQVLGDSRESSALVQTVPGKGYRFASLVDAEPRSTPQTSAASQWSLVPLPEVRRHNLPAEITSFVGRKRELTELPQMLATTRLLSLTGPGGVGKTRLALRLASELAGGFADGVWLVDLAPLGAPDLVAQTIATTLAIRESAQRSLREVLVESLRQRELLLVLDTCEHLVDACAELIEVLLRGAPALRVVATSRETLGVPGEIVYRVPSLPLPEARALTAHELDDSEATQLFVARATAIDHSFRSSAASAPAIAGICRRLDGIPLAIELAAACVVALTPEQIEMRLEDRFRLLTGGARTAVARQRTLEATVDWSYQILSDIERLLLNRLSIFPASWTLEAAEDVGTDDTIPTDDILDILSRLVAKSLVSIECDGRGERRYRLLETVRHYARERLLRSGDTDRLRERHFEFFFNEFRGASFILRGPGQLPCLARLRAEQENVRAALEWALGSRTLVVHGVELVGALFWYWTKSGLFEEGKRWLEWALAADAPRPLRARVLIGLAHMHYFQGHFVAAGACVGEALSLGRQDNDASVMSFALFLQALVAFECGDHRLAVARAEEARAAADVSGEPIQHGGPLLVLANVALLAGDHGKAQALYDDSIEVHRKEGDIWGLSILLSAAAGLRIILGDVDRARAQASEAMLLCEALEDPRGFAWSLEVFAGLLAAGGDTETAARLWGASDRLLEGVGGSLVPTIAWIRERYMAPARNALGDTLFTTLRAEGRGMPLPQTTTLARQLTQRLG